MRFKLYYSEKDKLLKINCLKDNFPDIILPENPDQHVYYPIPDELYEDIKKELNSIIPNEYIEIVKDLDEQISDLMKIRSECINDLRIKINPVIMERCKEFKLENAEYFI